MTENGRHIAVTGASGFIGSRLVRHLLAGGRKVTAIVRRTSDVACLEECQNKESLRIGRLEDDFSNLDDILSTGQIDVVIHLAACTDAADDQTATRRLIEANVLFPSLLLSVMSARRIGTFINTGTSWQSAEGPQFQPFNLYAATKQAFEQVMVHHIDSGLSAVTLRLFDVYGPDDTRNKIVNLLLRASASRTALEMTAGEQKIDLVHVDDVCRAYEAALQFVLAERPRTHLTFAVSSGKQMTVRDLVGMFETARSTACRIDWGKRPYRAREIMSPYAGLTTVPGWRCRVKLEDGLKAL